LIEIPDVECGSLATGGDLFHTVRITVINKTGDPVRLVGASAGCRGYTCHDIDVRDQVLVPAGAEVQITAKLRVVVPGPFDVPFEIFVNDGNLREVTGRFRGRGVSP
jgi:hypothetical protein